MHRFESQPAFVLHARPYRETSLLLELLTLDYGRIGVVAKGARKALKTRGLLQPFVPLLVACTGRTELLTLTGYEQNGVLPLLKGRRLISGFYLNELLMRLLHRSDYDPILFQGYETAVMDLATSKNEQSILRAFEKMLLKALGYGLQLSKEVTTGEKINPAGFYLYDPERGPIGVDIVTSNIHKNNMGLNVGSYLYSGKSLLALSEENLDESTILGDAKILGEMKRLVRQALMPHLGGRPIESRKLL